MRKKERGKLEIEAGYKDFEIRFALAPGESCGSVTKLELFSSW